MRKWLALCLLLFLSVASGCGFPQATGGHTETFYRMTDAAGREVVLAKKPERIIILAPSFLNIMHAVGGDFDRMGGQPGGQGAFLCGGEEDGGIHVSGQCGGGDFRETGSGDRSARAA